MPAAPMWIVVWLLGATQVVGYGTLLYAFPLLAPDIAAEIGWREDLVFAALSVGLLASGLTAPVAGRLADSYGAARVMTFGSGAAALALIVLAIAPGPAGFVAGVVLTQLASSFVLYASAFVVLVQAGGEAARGRITHLTLIAGFASTVFWPLTYLLDARLGWRDVYLVYAALNAAICLPVHAYLARSARSAGVAQAPAAHATESVTGHRSERTIFLVMLLGFAVEGFVLSAMLVHMVPMLQAVGLGAAALAVGALFGPAQVASRLVNMVAGRALSQTSLAIVAAFMLPASAAVLAASAPWLPGALTFAILFGFGSGLNTIVSGTLPLALFGARGYGSRLGWGTWARQFAGAFAPFAFAASTAASSTHATLWMLAALGLVGIAAFVLIALLRSRR
ncbi:MAG: arsenite efflux MFS transporter ArsK [Rhizobiaceae bacterium]|nr:arsenite efflux MFS transporter ArsK [Rhizobiaceae bacterium]